MNLDITEHHTSRRDQMVTTWSSSAGALAHQCLRAYWLEKVFAIKGYMPTAPAEVRDIYYLGRLQHHRAWAGSIVHDILAMAVRSGELDSAKWIKLLTDKMRHDSDRSADGSWKTIPQAQGLAFHVLGNPPTDEEKWKSYHLAVDCLKEGLAFLAALTPFDLLETEELKRVDLGGGLEAWVKLDLVASKNGTIDVIDWKTGTPRDSDLLGLGLYAKFVVDAYGGKSPRAQLVYLSPEHRQVVTADLAETMDKALRFAHQSMKKLQALDPLDIEQWPMTLEFARCNYCNFRKVCHRG